MVTIVNSNDPAPLSMTAGNQHCHIGRVSTVFRKCRPARPGNQLHQEFCQLHHDRRCQRAGIGVRHLLSYSLLNDFVLVSQNHRPIGAHIVDILVAIYIPESCTPRPVYIERVGPLRNLHNRIKMTWNTVGYNGFGTLKQCLAAAVIVDLIAHRRLLLRG